MARLPIVLILAVLASSLSGAASLVGSESCSIVDVSDLDNTCLPTCVTCGCCHQAAEVIVPVAPQSTAVARAPFEEALSGVLRHRSNDILHVPRA